jgi:hypothetical protein
MRTHNEALKEREHFYREFGVEPSPETRKLDIWPGYVGSFIRRQA